MADDPNNQTKLTLFGGELRMQAEPASGRREFSCRFIKAGLVRRMDNTPSDMEITPEPLRQAVSAGMFNARASFLDHAGWFDYPSLRNLVGVTVSAEWNEADQAVEGSIRLYDSPAADLLAAVLDDMQADVSQGEPIPDIGLSIVFWPKWAPRDNSDDPLRLASIRHIESVDFVFAPGAEGRIKWQNASLQEALQALASQEEPDQNQLFLEQAQPVSIPTPLASERTPNMPPEEITNPTEEVTVDANSQPPTADSSQEWLSALAETAAGAMIANSGLPQVSRDRLASQTFASPEQARAAIEAERAYLARLQEDQVVQLGGPAPRSPQISLGRTGLEQISLAIESLITGVRPPDGIQPLTGVREMYNLLSGDYEMHGRFQPDRVYLANVNSSTMAGLVANALNKVVANEFMQYPRWWEPFVSMQDFNTLQDVKWITLGGVGELPTVAAGAAYTELTWDDQTEEASFVKKGGYLGITIEAIDKDDTGKLRAAPRALAQSAWLTLGKAISEIFTSNAGVGPTMSDSVALFNAAHGNLGATALSFAAYSAVRTAMRKQTELNSGERLGALTAPKFLLVPPDLEITALQVLATEQQPGAANFDENPFAEGNSHNERMRAAAQRVITIDLWTDTNNWAAVADPRLYPSIGVGFRYGRVPEIFSVASPTAGLMFTNDTLPVKVRFFFAAGPTDWRGVYKQNVA